MGRADDRNDADGTRILSFNDVIRLVLKGREDGGEAGSRRIHLDVTVEDALQDYLEARKVRCSAEDLQKKIASASRLSSFLAALAAAPVN